MLLVPGGLLVAIWYVWRSKKAIEVTAADKADVAPGYPFGSQGWLLEHNYAIVPAATATTTAATTTATTSTTKK